MGSQFLTRIGSRGLLEPMHACLNVDEIVRLLACELVASGGKGSAVALACCCKNFEDPGLDALWEAQDQLRPLLKSLPEDVWDDDGRVIVSGSTTFHSFSLNHLIGQTFKRIPTKAGWARFQKYARRIRTLKLNLLSFPLLPDVLSVLQHRTLNTPLLPGLKVFVCRETTVAFVPFISLFLSQRITTIDIGFAGLFPNPHILTVASIIDTFPTICPNLQQISLNALPRDPVVTTAVSEILLACNRNTLQRFDVDSPLTEAAREVLYRLPNLSELRSVLEGPTLLPSVSLPNLVKMYIVHPHGHEWLQRSYGAALNKLTSVTFCATSPQVGNFLEAFEGFALATSIPTTLSIFKVFSRHPWNPNYSSLLAFKQLRELRIGNPCHFSCSSTIDDDIVINLARAMPKLEILRLGSTPCGTPTGVTVKGLIELARCIDLYTLRVHIRVDSLVQAAVGEVAASPSDGGPAAPREECALMSLDVGNTFIPEESTLTVALALLRIFPRISEIGYTNPEWGRVEDTIKLSQRLSNRIDALACSPSKASHDMSK